MSSLIKKVLFCKILRSQQSFLMSQENNTTIYPVYSSNKSKCRRPRSPFQVGDGTQRWIDPVLWNATLLSSGLWHKCISGNNVSEINQVNGAETLGSAPGLWSPSGATRGHFIFTLSNFSIKLLSPPAPPFSAGLRLNPFNFLPASKKKKERQNPDREAKHPNKRKAK